MKQSIRCAKPKHSERRESSALSGSGCGGGEGEQEEAGVNLEPGAEARDLRFARFLSFAAEQLGGGAFAAAKVAAQPPASPPLTTHQKNHPFINFPAAFPSPRRYNAQ